LVPLPLHLFLSREKWQGALYHMRRGTVFPVDESLRLARSVAAKKEAAPEEKAPPEGVELEG